MRNEIYTITLNPVIDVHYSLDELTVGTENFAYGRRKLAAGKGVNLSRALMYNGMSATAFLLLGSQNGVEYIRLLERDNIPCRFIMVSGRVREYISLNCPSQHQETRICMKDFVARDEDVTELGRMILREVSSGSYAALCGSLPSGVSVAAFMELCERLRSAGARLVIDTASLTLDELTAIKPWLIKPNKSEAAALLGIDTDDAAFNDPVSIATELATRCSRHVILSLGSDGIAYAGASTAEHGDLLPSSSSLQTYRLEAVPTKVYSTVGAGDSLLAGFLQAMVHDESDIEGALRNALNFAAKACAAEVSAW